MAMNVTRRLRTWVKWRTDGLRAYGRAYRATAGWDRAQRVPIGLPSTERLPVIFWTWNRLGRLPATLAMLAAQDVPVQALIWNNSPGRDAVDKAVAGALIPVAVHHSARNIGGFGRFYLARAAAEAGHRAVVFVDDDQDFGPETMADLLAGHEPRTMSGWWAWDLHGIGSAYHERLKPGAPADYVATCGMITDAALFTGRRVFRCPRRFWFVEDYWLCSVARRAWRPAVHHRRAVQRQRRGPRAGPVDTARLGQGPVPALPPA